MKYRMCQLHLLPYMNLLIFKIVVIVHQVWVVFRVTGVNCFQNRVSSGREGESSVLQEEITEDEGERRTPQYG